MTDVKLISARVYWEDATPYLSLKYEYKQDGATYEYFAPKIEFPLITDYIPRSFSFGDDGHSRYIRPKSIVKMHEGFYKGDYAIEFNNRVRPVSDEIKEMTISEIEKKLGYQIKIINKHKGEN